MTRMTTSAEGARERVENGLAALAGIRMRLELVSLRVSQAERRSGMVELLGPAMGDLAWIERKLSLASQALGEVWNDGLWKEGNDE